MGDTGEPISIVEDLDPDPPRRGNRQVWEVALGLLILLGVLGFAGWQWLHQSRLESEYQAGTAAVQRHDWDAAQAHFAAAAGYLDADRQAQNASTIVSGRNNAYANALAAQSSGNWAVSLQAIQQVVNVQPGYKDSSKIEEQATSHLEGEALSGSTLLRSDATPPGLYYYGTSGWLYLPGSDLNSRIRGTGPVGHLVYDVPDGVPASQPTPTPSADFQGSPQLIGRRLIAAATVDLAHAVPLSFDAHLYDRFEWGSDGVWAIGYDHGSAEGSTSIRGPIRSVSALGAGTLVYQSYNSPLTTTVDISKSSDKALIMDIDPNSDRYLIATWSGEDLSSFIDATVTNLYMARAGGDRQLLDATSGGGYMSAQFSEDGTHALVGTYHKVRPGTERQDILLLTLDGTTPPRTIAETNEYTIAVSTDGYFSQLNAAFVQGGRYAGDILVAQHESASYTLQMFDTNGGPVPLFLVEVPTGNSLTWSMFQGQNGGVLLIAREGYSGNDPTRTQPMPFLFVDLAPGVTPQVTRLILDWNIYHTDFNFATIAGDRLLFSTFLCCDNQVAMSVFSFPTSSFGAQRVRPNALYSQTETAGEDDLLNSSSQSFGATLFAYVSAGNLHARLYDGSLDVTLERHVTYLYNPALHQTAGTQLR